MKILIARKMALLMVLFGFANPANAWNVSLSDDHSENRDEKPINIDLSQVSSEPNNNVSESVNTVPEKFVFQKAQTKLSDKEIPVVEYRRAMHYLEKGEEEHAIQILEKVVKEYPSVELTRTKLAELYFKQNNLIEAENTLSEGLRIDELNPEYLQLIAMVYDRNQDPDKALTFLTKVREIHRSSNTYLSLLGHLYQETGHYSLAKQQYFKLLEREPNNPIWLLGLSMALDQSGQTSQALEIYQKIVREGNVDLKVLNYAKDRINKLKG